MTLFLENAQACPCSAKQLAGKHRGDLLIAIQRYVYRKGDAGRSSDLADVVLDRVAVNYTPRRVWAADAFGVVQHEHGFEAGKSRRHHFGAAAEPGEEMRLDEAGRDANVSREPFLVQINRRAGVRVTEISERRVVALS